MHLTFPIFHYVSGATADFLQPPPFQLLASFLFVLFFFWRGGVTTAANVKNTGKRVESPYGRLMNKTVQSTLHFDWRWTSRWETFVLRYVRGGTTFGKHSRPKKSASIRETLLRPTFTSTTAFFFVLLAFRCRVKTQIPKEDSCIPRRALGKQHGDTLTQTPRGTKIWSGSKKRNVHDWSVTSTVVGHSSDQCASKSRVLISYTTSDGGKWASFYSGRVLPSLLKRSLTMLPVLPASTGEVG